MTSIYPPAVSPLEFKSHDPALSGSSSPAQSISPRLNICFIAQNAYGAIAGGNTGYRQVGGVQNQTALMARWLVARGHNVSVITWNEGQEKEVVKDRVRIISMCNPGAGFPVMRFFYPRLTSLFSAMKRAGADIYFHNAAEAVTGLAAAWCKWHNRRFIYSAAAELACDVKLPLMSKWYDKGLYRYGVKHADLRIVQTQRQQDLLRNGFLVDALQLPMPSLSRPSHGKHVLSAGNPRILWVGRITPGKRLEWLLDIAEALSDFTFEVVGANGTTPYARELEQRARNLPNVVWTGSVPPHVMAEIYERCHCLCCTSAHEGFPNTFLEAWAHGLPIISSFDPDGKIERLSLGLTGNSPVSLQKAITQLRESPLDFQKLGQNGKCYFEEHHELDKAMNAFEEAFLNLQHS
jgi:glycosyltransferase involved in cell wall biosynthesis